jgi:hypothetical protein
MIHVPSAQEVFDETGRYLGGVSGERWERYLGRAFEQLVWWACAAHRQRKTDEAAQPEAFDRDPSQRNVP